MKAYTYIQADTHTYIHTFGTFITAPFRQADR